MKKILYVDDDETQIFTFQQVLKNLDSGYDVDGVNSGKDCLRYLSSVDVYPDLIVLDIMMPGMSGWDVNREILKNPEWKKIPVVFLTARTDTATRNDGQLLAEDFIEKPYEPVELKKRIDEIIKKYRN